MRLSGRARVLRTRRTGFCDVRGVALVVREIVVSGGDRRPLGPCLALCGSRLGE